MGKLNLVGVFATGSQGFSAHSYTGFHHEIGVGAQVVTKVQGLKERLAHFEALLSESAGAEVLPNPVKFITWG